MSPLAPFAFTPACAYIGIAGNGYGDKRLS